MLDLKDKLISLNSLPDSELSKILGLTVDVELNDNSNIVTGMIHSLLKNKKFLICKITNL